MKHGRLRRAGNCVRSCLIGETNFWPGTLVARTRANEAGTVTIDGGGTGRAVAATDLAQGAPVRVAVCPERIRLVMVAGAADCHQLAETIYADSITTLVLRTAGPSIRLRLPAKHDLGDVAMELLVAAAWAPADARLYPAVP